MSLGGVTNASTSTWLTLDKVFWNQKAELMDAYQFLVIYVWSYVLDVIIYFIVHIILTLINFPEQSIGVFVLNLQISNYSK